MGYSVKGNKCDDKIEEGWYRFTGKSGDQMATECPTLGHCATKYPIWLGEKHPTVQDGAVWRKVCYNYGGCCSWATSVKVRNCGDFYVYNLEQTHICGTRYCGNKRGEYIYIYIFTFYGHEVTVEMICNNRPKGTSVNWIMPRFYACPPTKAIPDNVFFQNFKRTMPLTYGKIREWTSMDFAGS